jgi:molybdate/tungstate transport system substrate-binding protein
MTYLLDPEHGLKVLDALGQPTFSPCQVASEAEFQALPQKLQPLVTVNP